jgi:SAM-dependent methyltransferase
MLKYVAVRRKAAGKRRRFVAVTLRVTEADRESSYPHAEREGYDRQPMPEIIVVEYRWNISEFAAGFDAAAEHIHPHYIELQDCVLDLLPLRSDSEFLLVDAGGGSGRFVEKLLNRFGKARAIIVDQSAAFLALAERRLAAFGPRADCRLARLQDDWTAKLPQPPAAIASMSAIHHLEPAEKKDLYRRCFDSLESGGVFINADEVRPADDDEYLARCRAWVAHKKRAMAAGLIPESIHPALRGWEERNVVRFSEPRKSGDDCHETIEAQLGYLTDAGFRQADCPWQREMWAILRGVK